MTQDAMDLSSLTVIEVSGSPGPAFAASLLADFGARVIVVEPPSHGSPIRTLGAGPVQEIWWSVLARNKLSLALDTGHSDARMVVDRLVEHADILIRDSDAGIWQAAQERNGGRALDLHLFAPGADWPGEWQGSLSPEFAAAATGVMALTGAADGAPVQPEFPLADYTAGTLAAAGALFELVAAQVQGRRPAPLAVGLHEALARMNEWQLVFATSRGFAELRNGNRFPLNANIGNIFRTRDSKLVTISAATPAVANRLLFLIGGEATQNDPRFATHIARRENMDELELLIADWMTQHDLADILRLGQEHDVVIGSIYDADDLTNDPHVASRKNIIHIPRQQGGTLAMPGVIPRIEGVEATIRREGPAVGQDSDAILASLGFALETVQSLRSIGAVWASREQVSLPTQNLVEGSYDWKTGASVDRYAGHRNGCG
jgi:crotonobetainyl-CoA:carnitine CoA-transferase CaiB-like acyl-CoA transferase